MQLTYNFNSREFDSPDRPESGTLMNHEFMKKLQEARTISGVNFRITSGFRSSAHNQKIQGKKNSAHLTGHAADIFCIDSRHRFQIVHALFLAGFNRIGLASNFIHVDDSLSLPENVIFLYP